MLTAAVASQAPSRPLADQATVILCYERVDGTDTGACANDNALKRFVIDAGGVLVDASQAQRLRSSYAPERFSDGAGLKGIDLLDAEVGLVVRATAVTLMVVGKVTRFQVDVSVDVVAAGRATIIATRNTSQQVSALNAAQALSLLGPALATALQDVSADLAAHRDAPATVEVWVDGLSGLAQVSAVERAITNAGATRTRRTAFDKGLARFRVDLAVGQTIDALALALEARREAGLFLRLQGSTPTMVQLASRPTEAAELPCVVTTTTTKGVPAIVAQTLDGGVRGALLRAGYITPLRDGVSLVVAARPARAARAVGLTFTLKDDRGQTIAATTREGAAATLQTTLNDGVDDLLGTFRRWLLKHPSALTALRQRLDAPVALEVSVTQSRSSVDLGEAPGARVVLGALTVATAVDSAAVSTRVEVNGDVIAEDADVPVRGGAVDVAITLPERLSLSGPTPATVQIETNASVGERLYRETRMMPLMLWPAHTIDVARPASVARLVDDAPPFFPLFRGALQDAPISPSPQLGRAARIWDVLAARRLRLDGPVTEDGPRAGPTPTATLLAGGGEPLALAALFASALLAADVDVRLLPVDVGGWLVDVDAAGVDRAAIGAVVADGANSFVPVDTSALSDGVDLYVAIERGQRRWRDHAPTRRAPLINPRQAWRDERPPALSAPCRPR